MNLRLACERYARARGFVPLHILCRNIESRLIVRRSRLIRNKPPPERSGAPSVGATGGYAVCPSRPASGSRAGDTTTLPTFPP